MKNIITKTILMAIFALPLIGVIPASAIVLPNWDTSGNYVVDMNYLGTDYPHDMALVQDGAGNLTGNGGSPAGANVYTWEITSGIAAGNSINFLANYTATADAVTPQTELNLVGTIAVDGTMSGTWSDNYQGGDRSGTWTTTSGVAMLLGTLSAEDFGVVSYDTGLGMLSGYTAGFGLTDATFAGATSVVVKLYSDEMLLQTNTAILPKFNADITGTQFSSPFDVSGTFDYITDGYWTNEREDQYGQSVLATKVVAKVTLENGKVVIAENTNLIGDPTTIYPVVPASYLLTVDVSGTGTGLVTSSPAGISCEADCIESYVDGTVVTLNATPSLGSSFNGWSGDCTGTGVCMVTMSEVKSVNAMFTLGTVTPPTTPTDKDQCKNNGYKTFENPGFRNQGQCVSFVASGGKSNR